MTALGKTGILIQARMGSSRFPEKVMQEILGETMIARVLERLEGAGSAAILAVVTSDDASDNGLCRYLKDANRLFFRGSLHDVLSRYYHAAVHFELDTIVRVTADCPLIDPALIENLLAEHQKNQAAASFSPEGLPDGFRFNILSFAALQKCFSDARLASEREHVVPYIWNHPSEFRVYRPSDFSGAPKCHLSVDYPEDLELMRAIYEELYTWEGPPFTMQSVFDLLKERPEMLSLNAGVNRVDGYRKSLDEDLKAGKDA